MRKRLWLVTTMIGCVALAGGALPALTAENGTVVAKVSVPLPPAPCLTLDGVAVDFGTLSFSDPAAASTPLVAASPDVHVSSCSTTGENLSISATNAHTTSGGTWQVADQALDNTCSLGPNVYEAWYFVGPNGNMFRSTPTPIFPGSTTLAAGGGVDITFKLRMPCRASAGGGETATMAFTTLAVLA
jgi:hypothetical protein